MHLKNFSTEKEREDFITETINVILRGNLHYFDEAEFYNDILLCGGITQIEFAMKIGRTQGYVSNKLRLLKLSEKVRYAAKNYMLSERHARALVPVGDEEKQLQMIRLIVEYNISAYETEEIVAGNSEVLENVRERKIREDNKKKIQEAGVDDFIKGLKVAEAYEGNKDTIPNGGFSMRKRENGRTGTKEKEKQTKTDRGKKKDSLIEKIAFSSAEAVEATKLSVTAVRRFTAELRKSLVALDKIGVIVSAKVEDTQEDLKYIITFPKDANMFWK